MTAISNNRFVELEKNQQAKSVLEAVVNVWSPAKGVSDGLAATTRVANLLSQTAIPDSAWVIGVKSGASSARSWMSPFYFPVTVKKFVDKDFNSFLQNMLAPNNWNEISPARRFGVLFKALKNNPPAIRQRNK